MHNYANVIYVIPSKVAKVVPVRRNMMVMQWLCECWSRSRSIKTAIT